MRIDLLPDDLMRYRGWWAETTQCPGLQEPGPFSSWQLRRSASRHEHPALFIEAIDDTGMTKRMRHSVW